MIYDQIKNQLSVELIWLRKYFPRGNFLYDGKGTWNVDDDHDRSLADYEIERR